jgi:hypothetical protein
MQQALDEREDASKRLVELQQIVELLKMDKVYLSKESENGKSRVNTLLSFLIKSGDTFGRQSGETKEEVARN